MWKRRNFFFPPCVRLHCDSESDVIRTAGNVLSISRSTLPLLPNKTPRTVVSDLEVLDETNRTASSANNKHVILMSPNRTLSVPRCSGHESHGLVTKGGGLMDPNAHREQVWPHDGYTDLMTHDNRSGTPQTPYASSTGSHDGHGHMPFPSPQNTKYKLRSVNEWIKTSSVIKCASKCT